MEWKICCKDINSPQIDPYVCQIKTNPHLDKERLYSKDLLK